MDYHVNFDSCASTCVSVNEDEYMLTSLVAWGGQDREIYRLCGLPSQV